MEMRHETPKISNGIACGALDQLGPGRRSGHCGRRDHLSTVERIEQIVAGERDHTSEFALTIAEHLLEYISHRLTKG